VTNPRTNFQTTEHLPECPLPVVHNLNGTGRDTLLREYREASLALRDFKQRLADTTCNGRDYYPIGTEAYLQARRTRTAVFSLLDEIETYLEDHHIHLANG